MAAPTSVRPDGAVYRVGDLSTGASTVITDYRAQRMLLTGYSGYRHLDGCGYGCAALCASSRFCGSGALVNVLVPLMTVQRCSCVVGHPVSDCDYATFRWRIYAWLHDYCGVTLVRRRCW